MVAARAIWGTLLLLAPGRFLGRPAPSASRYVAVGGRVLGARQLAEGAVLARDFRRQPPRWSIAIDAVHAASMLALALASPQLRRDALTSAAAATTLTALSLYAR